MTERNYTTDLIRGEDIEISIDSHNCIAHIDNGSGMTIMTLKTFGELKRKIDKPMTYFNLTNLFHFNLHLTTLLDVQVIANYWLKLLDVSLTLFTTL